LQVSVANKGLGSNTFAGFIERQECARDRPVRRRRGRTTPSCADVMRRPVKYDARAGPSRGRRVQARDLEEGPGGSTNGPGVGQIFCFVQPICVADTAARDSGPWCLKSRRAKSLPARGRIFLQGIVDHDGTGAAKFAIKLLTRCARRRPRKKKVRAMGLAPRGRACHLTL